MSDRQTLLDMGFPEEKVARALRVTKNAGLQPALDWIVEHGDDPYEEPSEAQQEQQQEQQPQKPPMSAEEKARKTKELMEKLERKREEKRLQAIEDEKAKEKVRRATGQEMNALREKMAQDQLKRDLEERKRDKEMERLAKERVKAQLEADKLERKRQEEERKRQRTGLAVAAEPPKPSAPVVKGEYAEARIQVRLPPGKGTPITQTFPATTKLSEVVQFVKQTYAADFKLSTTFPRKTFEGPDLDKTLKELGLCPSAALAVI
ncbi:ubiquitin-related domain-containing protein [Gorgonomyces haynaldii]|nr:ubiquitin-related domain-containing protein [Gorgonomyces haynaldii]